jgi:hypothetical protein
MGMIPCRCGHIFSTVIEPSPSGYVLISEKSIDNLRESGLSGDDVLSEIFLKNPRVYKCPKCERLTVFWKKEEGRYYKPDP